MLTVVQVAERLNVSPSVVYGLVAAGGITHHRLGLPGKRGVIRIAEADLDAFLASQKHEAQRQEATLPHAPVATHGKSGARKAHLELW